MEYHLNWDKHVKNISEAFQSLRHDEHLCDVTLACEGLQLQAHKVVLSAGSSFFGQILRNHKHPHPLVFLRGVESKHMESLLDFMYLGEVSVKQEELEVFIKIGEELGVRGLISEESSTDLNQNNHCPDKSDHHKTTENSSNCGTMSMPVPTIHPLKVESPVEESLKFENLERTDQNDPGDDDATFEQSQSCSISEWEDLRRYVILTEKDGKRSHQCSLCGKMSKQGTQAMMAHVESIHFKGALVHTCSICQETFATKNSLLMHKKYKHKIHTAPI